MALNALIMLAHDPIPLIEAYAMNSNSPSLLLATGSLEDLERAIDRLTRELGHDEVLLILDTSLALKQRVCDLHERCLVLALAWVQQHGPLVCGPISWEAQRTKKVCCRDVPATTEAVLETVGGDLAAFAANLVAQPYKHGACSRALVESTFRRLFTVTWDERLKLIRVDTRFAREAKGASHE